MTEVTFWKLIEITKKVSLGNIDNQEELLRTALIELGAAEILDFYNVYTRLDILSYKSSLWAAATLVNGGCSNDSFMDFRDWLILQGEQAFYKALENADSLVDVIYPNDSWAALSSRIREAYETVTKTDLPAPIIQASYILDGKELQSFEEAAELCPKIAAKFYKP